MSIKPLKIEFHMDGTGVFYDPGNPIHLDGLLAWALCLYQTRGEPPMRDEEPFEVRLPLGIWKKEGRWGWMASALLPDVNVNKSDFSLQYFRKKFRTSRVDITTGTAVTSSGKYKEWNMPMPLIMANVFTAYALGDRQRVQAVLKKHIRYLGKKRSMGKGMVLDVTTEVVEDDFSLVRDGRAMRYLPKHGANRVVRTRPPYWNIFDACECCDVGDNYDTKSLVY